VARRIQEERMERLNSSKIGYEVDGTALLSCPVAGLGVQMY